jgi:hypothetical protein
MCGCCKEDADRAPRVAAGFAGTVDRGRGLRAWLGSPVDRGPSHAMGADWAGHGLVHGPHARVLPHGPPWTSGELGGGVPWEWPELTGE